jgi:hypothetical protein
MAGQSGPAFSVEMTMETIFETREQWLAAAAFEVSALFTRAGLNIPANIRFACSWPVGSRGSKKILGQCVAPEVSGDGTTEVYVVPTIAEPKMVMGVLVHELVHAAVGVRHGHKAPFKAACDKLGLVGKATEALPGKGLQAELEPVIELLGAYPHAPVNLDGRKKQGTRMLKAVCPETGYTVRLTKKWADVGLPYSPAGVQMVLADDEGEE